MLKKIIIISLFLLISCNLFALSLSSKLPSREVKEYIYSEATINEMTEVVRSVRNALVSAGDDDWDIRSNFEDYLDSNKEYFRTFFIRIFKRYYYIQPDEKVEVSYLGFGFYKHAILIKIQDSKFVLKFTKKVNPKDIENEFNLFIKLKEPRIYLRGKDFIVEDFIEGQSFSNYLLKNEKDNQKTIELHKMFLKYIIDSYCNTVELVNDRIMGIFISDFNPKNFMVQEKKLICIDGGNSEKMGLWKVLDAGTGTENYEILQDILNMFGSQFNIPKITLFIEVLNIFYDNFKHKPEFLKEFFTELKYLDFNYISFNKYFKFSNVAKLFFEQPQIMIEIKYSGTIKNCA